MKLKTYQKRAVIAEIDRRAMLTLGSLGESGHKYARYQLIDILEGLLIRLKAAEELENG